VERHRNARTADARGWRHEREDGRCCGAGMSALHGARAAAAAPVDCTPGFPRT
jgi:hypothetical protein